MTSGPGERGHAARRAAATSWYSGSPTLPLYDRGAVIVEPVARFTRLKERVGILSRAADDGVVGGQRTSAMRFHRRLRNHRPHVFVTQFLDLGQLVRRPKPVKEMQERHPRRQGDRVTDAGEILCLLGVGR